MRLVRISEVMSTFLNQISRFRSELMGLTMIGVIVGHFITRCDLHSNVLSAFSRIFHVEIFVLLSGYGLVYAMVKRPRIIDFYKKRLSRVYLPFLMMTMPFFIYEYCVKDVSFIRLLLQLTALDYWFHGNYIGAWYVSFSILMYFLFPLFYRIIMSEDALKCIGKTMSLIALIVMLQKVIEIISPSYFTMIEIAMRHTPIFCFGILMGVLSMKRLSTKEALLFWGGAIWALLIFKVCGHYGVLLRDYGGDTMKIIWLVAICIVLKGVDAFRMFQPVMKLLRWVGKYSLELYILHIEIYVFCTSETIQPLLLRFMDIDMMKVMTLVVSVMICAPVHLVIEKVKMQIYAR